MIENYHVNCYDGICMTWTAEEFQVALKAVQDFKAEKRNAERASQIIDCMKEQLAELKTLGYTLRNQRDEYISSISAKKI